MPNRGTCWPLLFRLTLPLLLLAVAPLARATATNIAYYRFGENDPGAVPGGSAAVTTNLMGGVLALVNNATYSSNVSVIAASAVSSTLGLQFIAGHYGTNAVVSTLTNNFGLELWVNSADTNASKCLAYNGNTSANGWGLYQFNDKFQAMFGGTAIFGSATVTTGAWTHLALVRNNGTSTFYVNGAASGTTTTLSPVVPAGRFGVATAPDTVGKELFAGSLDEVRVFGFLPGAFATNDLLFPGPPSILSVSPSSGSTAGGTALTLTGTNFGTSGTVTIGGILAPVTSWLPTQILCTLPAGQGVSQSIIVTTAGRPGSPFPFSYLAPSLLSISPSTGPTAGGITLTISGTNFGTSGTVTVGGVTAALTGTGWSHGRIQCLLPAGQGLNQAVVVTVSGQASSAVAFSYNPPFISLVNPATGPTAGGTALTITGTNFGTNGAITIGGTAATVVPGTWTHGQIQCLLPAGQGLNQPVVVTTAGQVSQTVNFNYSPPSISLVNPATGPTAGGTTLTITGTNFGTNGAITIGGAAATVVPGTWTHGQIQCLLPAGQGVNLPVVVTTAGQASPGSFFSYQPPVIHFLVPSNGPTAGGVTITLTGTNFGASGTVTIGGVLASLVAGGWTNSQIQCILPAGQGLNQPVVVTAGSQASPAASFNYQAPLISAVTPSNGPTAGGTTITITGTNFGAGGAVTIGGTAALVISNSWTHSQIKCTLPVGQGTNQPVIVNVAGQASPAANFNYDLPGVASLSPTNGPTAGGITLTLTGTNFGTSGTVTIGGQSASALLWGHTLIQCRLPVGQGTNQPVVITVGGQSAQAPAFSYSAPSISLVNPSNGPTAGGITLTLTGTNFGTSGTVTVGGVAAPVLPAGWSHGQIQCTLPAGQGVFKQVIVTTAGQSSPAASFNYGAPFLTSITPSNGPTAGGITLTLAGTNFGTSGTVTLGGLPVTVQPGDWSHGQIQFTLPAGQGVNQPIVVTTASQVSQTLNFNYLPPLIDFVSPSNGPTAGGLTLTLTGSNFGTNGSVTVGGVSASIVSNNWTHTQIQCTLPAGQGSNRPVIVTVAGQASPAGSFSYSPPFIASVSPSNGPTAGGSLITLTGMNFGSSGTVSVGGNPGIFGGGSSWSNSQITCTLPAGQGVHRPVVVITAGQASVFTNFSYSPPAIASVNPSNGPTAGGMLFTLTGTNFGTSGTVSVGGNSAVFGPGSSWSDSQITCTLPAGQGLSQPVIVTVAGQASPAGSFSYNGPAIASVSPSNGPAAGGILITLAGTNFGHSGTVSVGGSPATFGPGSSWADSQIICTLPAGQGSNQPVIVTAGTQAGPAAKFNYSPPAISQVNPSNGPTAGGILITLTGINFGNSGVVTVGGNPAGFGAGSSWSDSQIQCTLPAGQGANQPVIVIAGNQSSPAGSFSYSAPFISGVSPSSGPTAGGTAITVTGTNFGASGVVTIGGLVADNIAGQWSHNQIRCLTPAGVGESLPVVVTTAGQSSVAGRFTYTRPVLTISSDTNGLTLAWPTNATDYQLEQAGDVGALWSLFVPVRTTNAGNFNVTLPPGVTNAFYRLSRP